MKRRRLPLLVAGGLGALLGLTCAAGGLLWLATPSYLDARLTGIERFEVGSEQCYSRKAQNVRGPTLYVTRDFISNNSINNIALWYSTHGWDALTLFIDKKGELHSRTPPKLDFLFGKATLYTGITLYKNVDNSTQIVMDSRIVFCPA